MSLGQLLREAREIREISRSKLGKRTGINQNSIAKYELAGEEGGTFPPVEKLMKLCVELKLDPRMVFMNVATDPDDIAYFATLDEQMVELQDKFEKFSSGLIAAMALTARKSLDADEDNGFTRFMSKTYKDMELEIEERGGDMRSLFQGIGPDQTGPSQNVSSTSEPEVAPTTSSNQPKEKEG